MIEPKQPWSYDQKQKHIVNRDAFDDTNRASEYPPMTFDNQAGLVFVTGARRDSDPNGGRMIMPPANKWERAQYVALYWRRRLERAKDAFAARSNYWGRSGASPPESKLQQIREELLRLKGEVDRMREQHRKAEDETEECKPIHLLSKEQEQAEKVRRQQDLKQLLTEIRV